MILKFKKQVLTIKIYHMNALQSYENNLLKLLKSINLSRRRIAFAFRYFLKYTWIEKKILILYFQHVNIKNKKDI